MKALVLKEKKRLSIEDVQLDEQLSADDVRIQIRNVGVCGSDVHYYLHGRIGPFVVEKPMILGHEASGIVLEVGKNVTHLKKGDRVCMEPGIPLARSAETLAGLYNLDPAVRFWATPPIHGCMRETVVHPGAFTFKLPDNVSLEEGALVEPVAIGVYSAHTAGIQPGDTALVFGAGTMGIVTTLAALASGCSRVVLTDIKKKKLELVRRSFPGNIACVDSEKSALDEAVFSMAPEGVDIVFEASGSPAVISSFIRYLRPGGRAVMIGMPPEPAPFDVVAAQAKEVRIFHIFRYRNMYPRTVKLISAGTLKVSPLITHFYDFKDALKAFEFAASTPEEAIKTMVRM
ncbi:MAG: NAD(P)-dependent alcohol dehydrogenase [Spirochaetia bacterium]|jgi:D-xylulose reductase